jgi:acyl-CoA dehydrogenase
VLVGYGAAATVNEVLAHILAGPSHVANVAEVATLELWWAGQTDARARWEVPVDCAVVCGFGADRLGYAFAAGYDAALRSMVPSLASDSADEHGKNDKMAAFCATEEGGNHPRSIRTSLLPTDDGSGWVLRGHKRWVTGGLLAERLLVVGTTGTDERGMNRLRVVRVDARAAGVEIRPMPPPPFTPEIGHAEVAFDGVVISDADVLPGDGYDDYLKPFRTIEDLHINAALLGYLFGVGRRYGWPHGWCERAVGCIAGLRTLALADPKSPAVHVGVAGVLAICGGLLADTEELWPLVAAPERERWERDRALLEVAGKARATRRERAWELLSA